MSDEQSEPATTNVDVDVTNSPQPEDGNAAPEHGDAAAGHPSEGGNEGPADKE